jgi:hypothetical protein
MQSHCTCKRSALQTFAGFLWLRLRGKGLLPIVTPEFTGVRRAVRAIAAAQIVCWAILIATPAQSLGMGWNYWKFFGHGACLFSLSLRKSEGIQVTA